MHSIGYTSLLPSPYEVHHPAGPPRYYDTLPMSGSDYPMHYHDADYNSDYGAATVAPPNSRGGGGPSSGGYSDKRPYDRSVDEFLWKGDRSSAAAAAQAAAAATNTYHHHMPGRGDYAAPPPQLAHGGGVNNNRAHGSSSGGGGGHTGRNDHRADSRDSRNRGRERTDYRDRSRSSFNRNDRR